MSTACSEPCNRPHSSFPEEHGFIFTPDGLVSSVCFHLLPPRTLPLPISLPTISDGAEGVLLHGKAKLLKHGTIHLTGLSIRALGRCLVSIGSERSH